MAEQRSLEDLAALETKAVDVLAKIRAEKALAQEAADTLLAQGQAAVQVNTGVGEINAIVNPPPPPPAPEPATTDSPPAE